MCCLDRSGEGILVITSHLAAAATAGVLRARISGPSWFLVFLLVPSVTWGDLYKWTDEQGSPVISNVRPANPQKIKNFETVLKETERTPTRTEQVLLDRIDNLERQLRTQQYPPQAPASSYAPYNESYYPAQAASLPPPPPSYSNGYYPDSYYYPWLPSYSYLYPSRIFVNRPRGVFAHQFAHHRAGVIRGSSVHRGRR